MQTIKIAFCGQWDNKVIQDEFVKLLSGRVKLEISDRPDFLVCGCFNNDFLKYGERPIRIYYYTENVFPDFNLFDYAIGFHNLKYGDRHLSIPYYLNYDFEKLRGHDNSGLPDSLAQRKFCNFIYRNTRLGIGSKWRIEFAKKLMQYKPIDCPGKSLNNMKNAIEPRKGDWNRGKQEFIKGYKFTIAFENSKSDGYTTEKMIDPLLSHSIPIYWGNEQAGTVFNPAAFINANDYPDLDTLVARIIEMDNDNEQYMKMLRAKPVIDDSLFGFDKERALADFMMDIFQTGKKYVNRGIGWAPFYRVLRHPFKAIFTHAH
ncbi:glycosyltransferase family 10 domain-containing protein [Candidatus Symbiothrix dinenymphae]|uniref:glycosyltransferase family 10 domain-containing protein n=1 Tax=Candidatus Symbiothrix dinenymphae TaxID=467085 RepID=UPI0006C6423E|nr:glycosyltransferase family 10 [Candidatus Symbiothrix dinenymphae]GAP72745.1 glycosyltransferase family 10 [Candidatus Symbiothrix dinenymphae]